MNELYGIEGGGLLRGVLVDVNPPTRMGQLYDAVLDVLAKEQQTACALRPGRHWSRRCNGCKKRDEVRDER